METPSENQQMTYQEAHNFAAKQILTLEKSDNETKLLLIQQGVDESTAKSVILKIRDRLAEEQNSAANKDMLYGALWCIGGSVATILSIGYVFWGAIVFGAVQFIKGASNYQRI